MFVTTCLSVGYAGTSSRARTPGKAIAAFLMTLGPSLSASLLAPPADERRAAEEESVALQKALLGRLDAILAELKARPAPTQGLP